MFVCAALSAAETAPADGEQKFLGSRGHPSSPSSLSEALWNGSHRTMTSRLTQSELDQMKTSPTIIAVILVKLIVGQDVKQ